MAYVRTFFAPSYMPFATARQMKRQIIKETKSETYPRIKIVKAAITCSATLNGAKVIGDLLACYMLRRIPHRHQVSERHDGNLYRCEHISLLFRIPPPHDQQKESRLMTDKLTFHASNTSDRCRTIATPLPLRLQANGMTFCWFNSEKLSLIVIWMVMAPIPIIVLLFVVPRSVLVILLVSFC
jgi:hypothetical protein